MALKGRERGEPMPCPERGQLEAYVLGRLDESLLHQTAAHAASCLACQSTLSSLDQLTDPLIDRIRRPADEATSDVRLPGKLGPYRVLGVLGRGGMGVVYRAVDTNLDRPVALKVMHPRFAGDASARMRFLREAKAAAALRDDHVVAIHHVGEDGEVAFLAMELLQGETLADLLRRDGRLPWREAASMAAQVADGLAAAHDARLIHRDIKPANVWLEAPSGRAKLLDFGLARTAAASETTGGLVLGTPHYMAPEQAAARPLDARADLYSLGVLLYRVLTGKLPIGDGCDDALAVLAALATTNPADPRRHCRDLPATLARLTLALLAKNPERRPGSAREAAAMLRQIAGGAAAPRRPWLAVGLATLAVAVSLAGFLWHGRSARDEARPPPVPTTRTLIPADFHFVRFSTDGTRLVTASFTDDDRLVAVWEFPSLRRLATLSGWEPGRRSLDEYGRRIKYHVLNGALSADGRRLALAISAAGDNSFALWDISRPGEPLVLRHDRANVHALAFSPDGRLLATGGAQGSTPTNLKLWKADTGEAAGELPGREANWVNGLAFSPDGGRLYAAYLSADWIDVLDPVRGTRLGRLAEGVANAVVRPGLALSADGRRVAFPTRDYEVRVVEVATGGQLCAARTTAQAYWGFAFSADGRRLATPDRGDESVTVRDVTTDKAVRTVTPPGPVPRARGLALSPDGRWLVTVGVDGVAHVWDIAVPE